MKLTPSEPASSRQGIIMLCMRQRGLTCPDTLITLVVLLTLFQESLGCTQPFFMPVPKWSLIFLDGSNIRVLTIKSTEHLYTIQTCALPPSAAPRVCLLLEPVSILLLRTPGPAIPFTIVRTKIRLYLNHKVWPNIIC